MTVEGYILTALVAFAGVYGAGMVSRYLGRHLGLPDPHDSEPARKMPHATAFGLERKTRPFLRWMFYLMFGVIVLVKVVAGRLAGQEDRLFSQVINIFGLVWVTLVLAAGLYGLAVALTIRCVSCGRRVLVKSMQCPPFPTPRNQTSALVAGQFQCMYCGQRYNTR
jgi:hypothetical protein